MRRPLLLLTSVALLSAACTSPAQPPAPRQPVPVPALELVAYDSCDTLLKDVRTAAKANVHPWGFGQNAWLDDFALGMGDTRPAAGAEKSMSGTVAAPAYSGTNNHELGVDEPDLVKTDGIRIVAIVKQQLRVIDAVQHRVTGTLSMPGAVDQILLNGDHALVMGMTWGGPPLGGIADSSKRVARPGPYVGQTNLWLVSLTDTPKIISSYSIDGAYADARQNGSVARVVVHSAPRIYFPLDARGDEKTLTNNNRKVIDKAPLSDWLPAYISDGEKGTVDCGDVSRPHSYSGTSLVTVLSFDLGRDMLGSGVPASVLADGETVYGSGTSLFIAHDERWRGLDAPPGTQIFQFDVTAMQPRYVAGGSVPGWLLNQYSLSEYDGVLRVATTTGHPWGQQPASTSTVYALRNTGGNLKITGSVGGLGKGEQIYAVRFVGPVGYVVTFRRTDPLYAIDLRDPEHPKVAGALKVAGYSAYLHPVSGDRLIGVGQAADDNGRVQGIQVSLFDVSDLSAPKRLANTMLGDHAYSEAEYDPHAFLYWPDTNLLVVPVQQYSKEANSTPHVGVSLVRVQGSTVTTVGWITHTKVAANIQQFPAIRRSLVIDNALWTISDAGVMASSLDGANQIAWLPL
jgi:uncharacterized secreted protein with C-terminal beta-propeller domain